MQRLLAFTSCCCTLPFFLSLAACSGETAGGTSGSGGSAGAPSLGKELLVDDFEDGDAVPQIPGAWYGYDDSSNGGKSILTFTGGAGTAVAINGAGYQSVKSLEVSYSFDQGALTYPPYLGFGASIGSASTPYDASPYRGLVYAYQGGAHRVRIETTDVGNYDFFGTDLGASSGWKTVILPLEGMAQLGWGAAVAFDPTHVTAISFGLTGTTGQSGKLQIDDVKLVEMIPKGRPDMTIQPSTPPADGVLDSIEITNPLQAKAMKYLDRGYSITNWLEQTRFNGFIYDEAFVEKLAAAGFKSLRLPIDLDMYVDATTGTGASLSLTLNPDLFEILDSFDQWTRAHGLSLTIDYHQYSTLPNKGVPDSIATMVALWGQVAEHFAANPREDLFFELLNEPELSFDGVDPTQAEWTIIAQRLIDGIRASDTKHTIIFGDTQWYGIGPLATRTPFTDTNVIYAFHDYDPFIFTHQGASWATMGSTHDLPFPYDPSRWSEYYSTLGFNSSMDSWILQAAQTYYQTGNRSAVRNTILAAKRWAATHNVPVICNEFGAYDATSRLEDRARYYTDIIAIFRELQIPWQHWFMVMDANGNVIPEYRAAMRLDD